MSEVWGGLEDPERPVAGTMPIQKSPQHWSTFYRNVNTEMLALSLVHICVVLGHIVV